VTLDDVDAGIEELLGPGGGGAEVEGPDLPGAAAEQLEAEGGADEALPAGHREPYALDPLVRAQMHLLRALSVAALVVWCGRLAGENKGRAQVAGEDNLGSRARATRGGSRIETWYVILKF